MVLIHADASGTYQGNGGFIMLNELAHQLRGMGYDVAFFDHLDRLHPQLWQWTGYPIPRIVPFSEVLASNGPIVTTWLHCWLDVLEARAELWPRLRYWCSGELLRDEPIHDRARQFVKQHIGGIAINNPILAPWYYQQGIMTVWHWTNWVRNEFFHRSELRASDTIGFQPDERDPDTLKALIQRYGTGRIIICSGNHLDVAELMQSCDLFLSWNALWPMTFGLGESFGLNAYEAIAANCAVVSRLHAANLPLKNIVPRFDELSDAFAELDKMLDQEAYKSFVRHMEAWHIDTRYRFDLAREAAIRGYLD